MIKVLKPILTASAGCGLKKYVRVNEWMCENPVMTWPIKKRIYDGLFTDRMAALYIAET